MGEAITARRHLDAEEAVTARPYPDAEDCMVESALQSKMCEQSKQDHIVTEYFGCSCSGKCRDSNAASV
jgi:hypothetical protein